MAKVVHFEVHAQDPQRAMKFYGDVFGWRFQKWEGSPMEYWVVYAGEEGEKGVNGGLLKSPCPTPVADFAAVNAFVCTMYAPKSLEESTEKILASGGTIAVPKMAIPGMAWLTYFKDPEGNIFGVIQDDKDAK
jgi:predicted enzyme related to lactoylglutathione lyase